MMPTPMGGTQDLLSWGLWVAALVARWGSGRPCGLPPLAGHQPEHQPRASALGEVWSLEERTRRQEGDARAEGKEGADGWMSRVGRGQGSLPRRAILAETCSPQGSRKGASWAKERARANIWAGRSLQSPSLVTALERETFSIKTFWNLLENHTKNKNLVHNLATSKAVKIPSSVLFPSQTGRTNWQRKRAHQRAKNHMHRLNMSQRPLFSSPSWRHVEGKLHVSK